MGAGIALSGGLVALVGSVGDWRVASLAAAGLTALLLALGWPVGQPTGARSRTPAPSSGAAPAAGHGRSFVALAISYFPEGAG